MSEQLIYAMSTRTELSLELFNNIFQKVYLPGKIDEDESADIDMRRHVIRSLDSLGYCEFDFEERVINMCPPCLILLPSCGIPRAIFIGARTPSVIAKLKSEVRKRQKQALLSYIPQDNRNINVPASIFIDAVDKKTLVGIAGDCGIEADLDEPASWKLANFSVSVNGIEKSLAFEQRQEPNWSRRIFQKDKLVFTKYRERRLDSLELAEYINPVDQQRMHWLWLGNSAAEVNRDWGRFIALSREKRSVILYDEKLRKLAVPLTVPLPCILARALALCSGKIPVFAKMGGTSVPSIPSGHPLQIYMEVPPVIAELMAGKLSQGFIPAELNDIENGVDYD